MQSSTNHHGLWAASSLSRTIPHITFSTQNCNSLNISTMCNKQLSKLIAITALCSDIIFLSDLRMNDDNDAADKISKILICNKNRNYFFHYNSISNCRGVGILIACDLPCKIIYTYKDMDDNILGLVLESDSNIFSICSVYGPNDNNRKFFSSLSGYLESLGDVPTVIGGDWNATYSQSPSNCNPDMLNMASPPSLTRSGWIADICSSFGLLDPFRAFHPTRRDFTYFPHGARKNRSRIDFFLISESLLSSCRSCNISPWLSTSLFNHKSVTIDFSKEKVKPKLLLIEQLSLIRGLRMWCLPRTPTPTWPMLTRHKSWLMSMSITSTLDILYSIKKV